MKYFNLYIKTECPFCKKAVDKLEELDKMMVVTVLDRAPPEVVAGIKAQFHQTTVPIVLEVDENNNFSKIGGCDDLMKYLNVQDAKWKKLEDMSEEERQEDEEYWHGHGQGD